MLQENWIHFTLPTRVHFESGSAGKIGTWLKDLGTRFMLVNIRNENKNPADLLTLKKSLDRHTQGAIHYDSIFGNPDTEQLDSAAHFAKKSHVDAIVAFGSIDTFNSAKAIALLVNNPVFAADLISGKANLSQPALPVFCVPIEPGPGFEFIPGFTLVHAETGQRGYFEHPSLYPSAVFYDPSVSLYFNAEAVSRVGAGMLATAIESALSGRSNPLTMTLILKAMESIHQVLPQAYRDPRSEQHITTLMWASVILGVTLPSNPMGTTWAMATALQTESGIDFGNAMGILAPHVMEYFLTSAPNRYVNVARALGQDVRDVSMIEAAIQAVDALRSLYQEIKFPVRLSEFEVNQKHVSLAAEATLKLPQYDNAPRALSKNEVESIFQAAM